MVLIHKSRSSYIFRYYYNNYTYTIPGKRTDLDTEEFSQHLAAAWRPSLFVWPAPFAKSLDVNFTHLFDDVVCGKGSFASLEILAFSFVGKETVVKGLITFFTVTGF